MPLPPSSSGEGSFLPTLPSAQDAPQVLAGSMGAESAFRSRSSDVSLCDEALENQGKDEVQETYPITKSAEEKGRNRKRGAKANRSHLAFLHHRGMLPLCIAEALLTPDLNPALLLVDEQL